MSKVTMRSSLPCALPPAASWRELERQTGMTVVAGEIHCYGVEAVDVAAGVGDRRTEAAEFVGSHAVFEWIGQAGEILKVSGPGLIECADRKERSLRLRDRGGDQ